MHVQMSNMLNTKPHTHRVLTTLSPEQQLAEKMQELYDFEAGLVEDVQNGDNQPVFVNKTQYSIIDKDGFESYSCGSCRFEHEDLSTMNIHCSTQTQLGTSSTDVPQFLNHAMKKISQVSYPVEPSSVKNLCAKTDDKAPTVEPSSQSTILDKALFSSSSHVDHHQMYSEVKRHENTTDNMVPTRFDNINSHVPRQVEENPYSCVTCKQSFSVNRNTTVDTPPQSPYKCLSCESMCKEALSTSKVLTVQSRTQRQPHKCTICKKSFSESCTLKIHVRTHTGENPYKCTVCQRSFSRSSNLTSHERMHSGEKPYKCLICEISFSHRPSLTYHERKYHEESHSSVHAAKIRF